MTNRLFDAALADDPSRSTAAPHVSDDEPARRRTGRVFRLQATRLLLDAVTLAAAAAVAFPLRFRWHLLESTSAPLALEQHVAAAALWIVGVLGPMASHRLYDEDTLAAGGQEMTRVRRSLLEGVALVSTAVFLLRLVTVSRGWFLLAVVLSTVLLSAQRRAVRWMLKRAWSRGRLRRRAILVGAGPAPSHDDPAFEEFDLVEIVRPEELQSRLRSNVSGTGRGDHAPVVIIDGQLERDALWRLVMQAGDVGASVFLSSPFRALPADRLSTRTLGERTMVKVSPPAITGIRAAEKRLLDVVAAGALLAVAAVPMILIGLAVLFTSGRPVFYRQQRMGRGGRLFSMWKFRTMRDGAEHETGPVWATQEDARRTTIGVLLRRLSFDELPQLWNVLRGDMSIVGPRPERPVFVARFTEGNPWYGFRHRIRPGITGLSQVRGLRGDTPLEPRVEADNWYIEHWSLALDVRIAARTLLAMLHGRNAH